MHSFQVCRFPTLPLCVFCPLACKIWSQRAWWSVELTLVGRTYPVYHHLNICSTAANGCLSRQTLWLNQHKCGLFIAFGTTTIPTHHSVGSCILAMTPKVSIRCCFSFTAFKSGSATRRGVVRANGFALGSSLMVYSPSSLPRPVKSFGNCVIGLRTLLVIVAMQRTRFSCSISGSPRRGLSVL